MTRRLSIWLLIPVFLMVFAPRAKAQNPGYLGRNTYVQGGVSLPSIFPVAWNGEFPLNYRIGVARTLSHKMSLGLEYEYLGRQTILQDGFEEPFYTDGTVALNETRGYHINMELRLWSYKRHGAIAPLGRYYGFRLGYMRVTAESLFPNGPPDDPDFAAFSRMGRPTATFITGRQWIFGDWVTLDISGSLTYAFGSYSNTFGREYQGEEDVLGPYALQTTAFGQILRMQVLVGGLLPF